MEKEELNELICLSVYGELSDDDEKKLDAYIRKHPESKKELNELRKLRSFISGNSSGTTADVLLDEARAQFRIMLRKQRPWRSGLLGLIGRIREILSPRFAVTGAGALSLGILIGYCSFNVPGESTVILQPVMEKSTPAEETRIENIRFIDADGTDGEVEFMFEAVAPMTVKGKIDDPEIQKVLTHALLNAANPGVRLSSVNTLGMQIEEKSTADPSVRNALIATLRSDGNPGVRREALRVLQQCSFGNDIRDAFLHVLMHDENSGMRVAAINALETASMDGNTLDRRTVDALNRQMKNEQNHYIRNRAANLVKEIYQ